MPALSEALIQLQISLQPLPFPVLLGGTGDAVAGKDDVVNTLNGWLDPRGVETCAFHDLTDAEWERPPMWRFWRSLPPRGHIAIYAGGGHSASLEG